MGDAVRQMLGIGAKQMKKIGISSKQQKLDTDETAARGGGSLAVTSATTTIPWKKSLALHRPVRKWSWHPFTHPSRSDDLVLSRWERSDRLQQDYAYAAFNKKAVVLRYNDELWDREISNLEPEEWTKEETDHLLDLCERFDLRFHVINDRFDEKYGKTIEDIKHRYYSIAKVVLENESKTNRDAPPGSPVKTDEEKAKVFLKNSYSRADDKKRKKLLAQHYDTPQEVRDREKKLLELLRKLEGKVKKEDTKKALDKNSLKKPKKRLLAGGSEEFCSLMLPMTLMPKKGAHMRSSCEIPLGGEVAERHSGLIQECLAKLNCKERERMYTKECVLVRSALKNDILAAAQLERLIKCKQEDIAALQDFIRGRTDDELGGAGENIGPAGVGGKTGGAFIK
eukprot:GHVL01041318.1.p1 GENE.GHVL01041318.1~~GHVL01041318.1.p1  ORF type:complete len:397 (+),score=94.64 GHVL01041318.1:68-1258(+)